MPEDRWASSHLVQHQDRSFISVEVSELVIARFKPAGYEEVDSHAPADAHHPHPGGGGSNHWRNVDRAVLWAHPAFANGHVVARKDAEVVRVSLFASSIGGRRLPVIFPRAVAGRPACAGGIDRAHRGANDTRLAGPSATSGRVEQGPARRFVG